MAAIPAAPSRRARTFFDAVINEFGIREGDLVRIPMRQCELAQRKRVAASTIGSYLTSMGTAVVSRYPQIVISLTEQPAALDELPALRGADRDELLAAYASLVAAQSKVIELLANPSAIPRAEPIVVRADREELPGVDRQGRKEGLPSSFLGEPRVDGVRIRGELREDSVARLREVDAVLEPLHALIRQRQLKPMNNRAGVMQALSGFTAEEIEHAVSRLVLLIQSGETAVLSPFGLLVQWARNGEVSRFADPVAVGGPTIVDDLPVGRPVVEMEEQVDLGDTAAVLAMEASPGLFAAELADLDRLVAATHPHLAGLGIRPAMRHALRVAVLHEWIAVHGTTGIPRACREDTAGTAQGHPEHSAGTPPAHRQHTPSTPAGALTARPHTTNGAMR